MKPADAHVDLSGAQHMSQEFLKYVFTGQEIGYVALFRKPGNHSDFFPLGSRDWSGKAAECAMLGRDTENIYFAIGVQRSRPDSGRGKEDDVIAIPGLWIDIDVLGPNHTATDLPPTEKDALSILEAGPFKPTIVVHTGGGLQAYWSFREPMDTVTAQDRAKAKLLSKGFQKLLAGIAERSGWSIDRTADLCRLLRVPGTYNRKQSVPVLVRCDTIERSRRYNPSDFQELIELDADPDLTGHIYGGAPTTPTAEFAQVLAGCPWIEHCKVDAARLPEPEWYRMLSIVGRCKSGNEIAHELSKPYPNYSASETDQKLRQAMDSAGPVTCAFVANELGQEKFCGKCEHRGKIKSPIVLGIPGRPGHRAAAASTPDSHLGDTTQLPNIQANDRQLRDLSRQALEALKLFNNPPSLFSRSGRAVCITQEESGRHVIHDVSDPILRNRMTRSANYFETIRHGTRRCAPPLDAVKDILAMPPLEWEFPRLVGLIEAPALREDGSLITLAGYDTASGLFYAPGPGLNLPPIPDQPTRDQVSVAAALILDLIGDFPFVDQSSRANAIATILTPVCRPAIKGPTPMALIDATNAGTGKTLLSEVTSIIVSGREGALFSAPRDAEEWRKQLTSVLREGTATVIIDNVNYCLDSADLCKALTATVHGDRILGHSRTINLPVRCTWMATGNHIQLGGDMPRRCYLIRMDAKCPRPFERTGFKHPRLKEYARLHRGELLSALLTLARSWYHVGCPQPDVPPRGSYEDWTMIVGGILQNAGIEGFLANSSLLYGEADTEAIQWEAFLKMLGSVVGSVQFTVARIWQLISARVFDANIRQGVATEGADELRAVLPDSIAEVIDREAFFKQRLGLAFGQRVGHRFGDSQIRVERAGDDRHGKTACWIVRANTD